ncbi:cupin domain-containing protein [Meiothermus granaticius]|uniref:Quercetin 2,3-dioxygenase n=1 Tax=Meiothermus granaticius NBRC 107808 TaxID=1227551 RepID=A0A399FAT4_9DEIN|nr:cupin domain-containing protein [Meiothermus granaticius]MCL6525607.1 cupin domain-containing protein [Thermaceae bacterium]RIH93714.1 Quercetin 2,3-dioxygenase [Meiothermus granaticius NBRC 107808]GEM85763.1 cupin [Meiothermus granaticius NBRC 107808]
MNPIPASPALGTSLNVLGTTVTYLATERETAGNYALFELTLPSGEGMVPHQHPLESEHLYVLEGQLTVRLEDTLMQLEAGQSLFIPREAVHAFQNTAAVPARVLATLSPGFPHEKFFAELGRAADLHDKFLAELGLRSGTPKPTVDLEVLVATAERYGITILP